MLFNSFEFFVFLAVVYGLYRVLPLRQQNIMLLAASYVFYGAWDWRFLTLIWISTTVDFIAGRRIAESESEAARRFYLTMSIAVNLSLLGFFKYFNFFVDSLSALLLRLGMDPVGMHLEIVLPVGISFYTFQTMTYSIDIYRRQVQPTRNALDFALFVAFFPQLVAGPIERAKKLLPQISGQREITPERTAEGVWLIAWGLFKKVVIADNVAVIVNEAFANSATLSGPEVVLAAYAFAFQIYCDFSGYSDIARGVAKLLGIDLMLNFNLPFLASSPADFWRRWHISLSSWLRDYLYVSLGGNRHGTFKTYRNLMLTMLLGGLWHGAAWTFVIWGLYQGLALVVHRLCRPWLVWMGDGFWWDALRVLVTFNVMAVGWLIFRAESFPQLFEMVAALATEWDRQGRAGEMLYTLLGYAWPLIVMQAVQGWRGDLVPHFALPQAARIAMFSFLAYTVFVYGVLDPQEFIYFQF